MNGMEIRRIDPFGDEVYAFRREVICTDEGYPERYLTEDIKHSPDIPEEVWKFSLRKWNSLWLTNLHGVFINGDLAAVSGSKLYGPSKRYLRTGMMYYVLKRYRKDIRSMLWRSGGLLDSALDDHRGHLDYSFVSIYPHNNKLMSWCKALMRRYGYGQIGVNGEHVDLLSSYRMLDITIRFNNVDQYILFRSESVDAPPVEQMLEEISDN